MPQTPERVLNSKIVDGWVDRCRSERFKEGYVGSQNHLHKTPDVCEAFSEAFPTVPAPRTQPFDRFANDRVNVRAARVIFLVFRNRFS